MSIIFLTYMNRSGSTFLASELHKCNAICSCPEANILVEMLLTIPLQKITPRKKLKIEKEFVFNPRLKEWDLKEDDFDKINTPLTNIDYFLKILHIYKQKRKPIAKSILFKAERLIEFYNQFQAHNFLRIILLRDCRAIFNSQKRTNWPGSIKKMSKNPVRTAVFWNSFMTATEKLSKSGSALIIKYEDLIQDFEKTLDRICKNTISMRYQIDYPADTYFHELADINKDIHKNIILPPKRENINKWEKQLSEKEIKIIQFISGRILNCYGYELINFELNMFLRVEIIIHKLIDKIRRFIKKLFFKLFTQY